MPAKPSPKHVKTVCAVCGRDWRAHGANPTTDDCIRLLKADLSRVESELAMERCRPKVVPCPLPPERPRLPYYTEEWRPSTGKLIASAAV